MVDFRYHLVSLIAVFMALAIGIVLGAGPLQNSIGNTLTDQVTSLRQSRDEAREDAETAEAEASSYRSGLEAVSDELLAGSLEGVPVTVITLPGANTGTVAELADAVKASGGQIAGQIEITAGFFSSDLASYREALAGQLSSYVTASGDAASKLAAGLATIALDGDSENAPTLRELYTAEDNPLIKMDADPTPARALLVVAPEEDGDLESLSEEQLSARAAALKILKELGDKPMVLVGSDSETSIVREARSSEAGEAFSTVDSLGDPTALINAPWAITQELAGTTVAWGLGTDANAVIGEAVTVPPPAPAQADEPTGDVEPSADGEAADETDEGGDRDAATSEDSADDPTPEQEEPPAPEES